MAKTHYFLEKKLDSLQNTIELEMLKLHESHVEANVLEDFSHYSYEGLNFEKFWPKSAKFTFFDTLRSFFQNSIHEFTWVY